MTSLTFLVFFLFVVGSCALSARDLLHVRPIGWAYVETAGSSSAEPLETRYLLFEVLDLGRFLEGKEFFARLEIAQYWLRPQAAGDPWRTIDLGNPAACSPPTRGRGMPAWHGCKPKYVHERFDCTPASLEACRLAINATPTNNFVDVSKRLENGTYVIATKHREFYVMLPTTGWAAFPMPPSGIVLADVPSRARVRVGTLEFEGSTPWRTSVVYVGVDTATLYYDSEMFFDDKRMCKTFGLVGNSTGTFIRCQPSAASKFILYAALIVVVLIGGGGTFFAVKVLLDCRAKRAARRDGYHEMNDGGEDVEMAVQNGGGGDAVVEAAQHDGGEGAENAEDREPESPYKEKLRSHSHKKNTPPPSPPTERSNQPSTSTGGPTNAPIAKKRATKGTRR